MASEEAVPLTGIVRRCTYRAEFELTNLEKKLNDERQARAYAQASLTEAAMKSSYAPQKLSAAEAKLEATLLTLAKEKEHCRRFNLISLRNRRKCLRQSENQA